MVYGWGSYFCVKVPTVNGRAEAGPYALQALKRQRREADLSGENVGTRFSASVGQGEELA